MRNKEFDKILCKLIIDIAEGEKKKAIGADDYGIAFIAAIIEGIFKEAKHSIETQLIF